LFTKISNCRICKNSHLELVIDLGEQHLTGIFLHSTDMSKITKGPLRLVKCHGDKSCGLLQLEHTYSLSEMYGKNYGYRSGLNQSMVKHLKSKVERIVNNSILLANDLIIDIGSNDGTTLGFYPSNLDLVGIDPTGSKFKKYYADHVKLIPDFFSADLGKKLFGEKKAKVVTSFSMFYDLDSPVNFAKDIASILDPKDGIWVFEQSYMPLMLEMNSYDTICHEHLEYYALTQILWIADKAGLKVIDVETNDVNGGSFSVVAALKGSDRSLNTEKINAMLEAEEKEGLSTLVPYQKFFSRIKESKIKLKDFVLKAKLDGKRICGLGASTKGNVLLQFCEFSKDDIEVIGEVNPDKFGAFAPGTCIPIMDEKKVLSTNPDYLLVLPWHFKPFFLNNPAFKNRNLVFPLPEIEIVAVK
jgi:NDP-4-keto-2,6-dideoxyhexose 3-C-methyltransferase